MLSLSDNNQADAVKVFNSTSRYFDDLLKIRWFRLLSVLRRWFCCTINKLSVADLLFVVLPIVYGSFVFVCVLLRTTLCIFLC